MAFEPGDAVDLRALEYISEYNEHLMCPVCHCPFISPVRLRCDHVFCQRCLNRCITDSDTNLSQSLSDDFPCPSCRTPTNASFTTVPRLVISMCDDVLVKCPFSTEGCEEAVQRGHIQAHVDKYCDYRLVDCPDLMCEEKVRKRDLDSFGRCLHKLQKCDDCGESVAELDIDTHKATLCSSLKTTCSGCGESVQLRKYEEHCKTCPKFDRPCHGAPYGCRTKLRTAELIQHEESCNLAALAPYLESQSSRIAAMDATIRLLQQRNEVLQDAIAGLRNTLTQTPRPTSRSGFQSITTPTTTQRPGAEPPSPSSFQTPSDGVPAGSDNGSSPAASNATTYLLSIHESLREEVSRLSNAMGDLDARASMSIMNENLRIREDMAHINAGLNTVRMQVHWLMNSRLHSHQLEQRSVAAGGSSAPPINGSATPPPPTGVRAPAAGTPGGTNISRRFSDSGREGTKL